MWIGIYHFFLGVLLVTRFTIFYLSMLSSLIVMLYYLVPILALDPLALITMLHRVTSLPLLLSSSF